MAFLLKATQELTLGALKQFVLGSDLVNIPVEKFLNKLAKMNMSAFVFKKCSRFQLLDLIKRFYKKLKFEHTFYCL